jgi:predicted MFS family arabinose efflux permease
MSSRSPSELAAIPGAGGISTVPRRMDRSLVVILAAATGLSVANNYYAQPLLPVIGRALHMAPGVTGFIVTAAQVGYALGLILLVPLGDLVERRRLVAVLSAGTGLAMFGLAASPSAAYLLPAAFVVGALSVLAQVLVPFAAALAADDEKGRVVGSVMSGLLIGILLARTVSGLLAEVGTWRVVYVVAGAAMIAQAALLRWRLPAWQEHTNLRYPQLVASVVSLLKEERVLRLRALYGLMSFGSFSVLWTSMALLLATRYHYSSAVIGLFGLAGAAGAASATVAGRLSDRGLVNRSTGLSAALLLASWGALWAGGSHVFALVVGIVVLDVAANGLHITNQGEIYRLRPEARSRLTSAYMFMYFVGGATGSVLSTTLYAAAGWAGVCVGGAAFGAGAVVLWAILYLRQPKGEAGSGHRALQPKVVQAGA